MHGSRLTPGGPCSVEGMPTYGYRCPKGHEFEAIHGMGAPPPTACQVCGAAPVSRVFYPISISFTGTGFYSTDYGQGAQKPEAGVEQKSDAAASAGDGVTSANAGKKTNEKSTKRPESD
jgi:putative FmdB family regulatory protein